ncbi:hypothetical protein QBC34DRAFT_312549 [Podospora aff. communis PSN243]|uniref:Phospholipase C n=1 Tax=Podospora aff. communis PSN243 TaxID=3040156 RepID=A0AAV9G5E1_9PEZI|nr:hypothetical protein QBC34DRAFT_312549 [Podospora aff. communis PSN243]
MEFAEHVQLGDPVRLSWHDDTPQLAKSKPFKLDNGLRLTYGQICALGGDFFGYKEPICFGKTFEDQITRFTKGFETLATGTAAKALAEKVLKSKEEEVAAVEAASQPGSKATTDAYYNSIRAKYIVEIQNILGGVFGGQEKGYLGLSLLNLDHFGADARTAYNAGHTAALRRAAKDKTAKGLEEAYAMNAFADHYLQDSFASGHMRVPRRKLCAGVSGDLNYARDVCAHAMHREDNKEGLVVKNPLGQSWRAYGDSALFSPPNRDNLARCRDAVAASANEVYEAWQKQTIPPVSSFKAWQHAPTLESALDPANKNHPPMFNKEGCPRTDVLDKTCKTYESPNGMFWSYLNTARKLLTSGH